jgi:hypothetical protein
MRTVIWCILPVTIFLSISHGSTTKLPKAFELDDGTVYEEVRLISQTPSEVVFMHTGGAINLEKSKLPAALQEALNFSAENAVEYIAQKAKSDEQRREKAAELEQIRESAQALKKHIKEHTYMIRGRVGQITPVGILIKFQEPSQQSYYGTPLSLAEQNDPLRYRRYSKARPRREFGWLFLTGHPRQEEFVNEQVLDVNAYSDGVKTLDQITAKKYVFLQDFK